MSYSRHDESLVRPLAGLLGVAADDAVFLDVTSIKPGDVWDNKIMDAVKEASVFVVCWCCEGDKSTFIAKEISAALAEGGKRLVPVLFCPTPLPPSLADRQWIDLRGQVVHNCPLPHVETKKSHKESPPYKLNRVLSWQADEPPDCFSVSDEQPDATPSRRKKGGYALAAMIVLCLSLAFTTGYVGFTPMAAPRPPGKVEAPILSNYLPILVAGLLLIAIAYAVFRLIHLFRVIRRRRDLQRTEKIAAAATIYFEGLGRPQRFP